MISQAVFHIAKSSDDVRLPISPPDFTITFYLIVFLLPANKLPYLHQEILEMYR